MQHLCRGKRQSEHGDVVFLAEGPRGLGDFFGGFSGNGGRALKAEELAMSIAGFDHAVTEQHERVTGHEL